MRRLRTITQELVARRHTALLIAIAGMFAVRPLIGDTEAAAIVFSLTTLVVLLCALLTIRVDDLVGEREALLVQRRRRRVVGLALAVPAVAERVWMFFAPSNPGLVLIGSICWLVFFSYVAWSQLRSLLKQREVTGETISMSISVYLLLGLAWGLLYIVIFARHPEAFSFGTAPRLNEEQMFPIFIYFSLTTLSTIGFGDITPLSLQARYVAVAEGITGQFYLAILVARLVGMQMSRAATPSASTPAADRWTGDPDR
jgi:ion channel